MNDLPGAKAVFDAIDVYLRLAYDGPPPQNVRARVQRLEVVADVASVYSTDTLENDGGTPPQQYRLRLGNHRYPHMKLVIERAHHDRGFFFAADTHDRHFVVPPGSADEEKLRELREANAKIVASIEAAWEREGIPTFKAFLRHDLERRRNKPGLA